MKKPLWCNTQAEISGRVHMPTCPNIATRVTSCLSVLPQQRQQVAESWGFFWSKEVCMFRLWSSMFSIQSIGSITSKYLWILISILWRHLTIIVSNNRALRSEAPDCSEQSLWWREEHICQAISTVYGHFSPKCVFQTHSKPTWEHICSNVFQEEVWKSTFWASEKEHYYKRKNQHNSTTHKQDSAKSLNNIKAHSTNFWSWQKMHQQWKLSFLSHW